MEQYLAGCDLKGVGAGWEPRNLKISPRLINGETSSLISPKMKYLRGAVLSHGDMQSTEQQLRELQAYNQI